MEGTGWAATVSLFRKLMKQPIISTIAVALLAGCGPTLSQNPAEAKPAHAAAKVEVPGVPIHQAAWKGDMGIVQQHLAAGTGVDAKNKWGSTALHYTARGGQVAVAGLLISSSADVNAGDAAGLTPLHFAASAGHGEVAKLLIAKGADVKGKGGERKASPIFSAVKKSRGNIVELLLAKGADVNAKDAFAESPLDSAVKEDLPRMVELLLANGANVNGAGGTTPLHKSASTGQKEIVELLLANGANVNVTIAFGDTALDWAVRNNKEDVAAILRKYGGKTGEELKAE